MRDTKRFGRMSMRIPIGKMGRPIGSTTIMRGTIPPNSPWPAFHAERLSTWVRSPRARNWALLAAAGIAGLSIAAAARRRNQISFHGASVVITGGSRGLGLELAREFASRGARIALLARDRAELERARDELLEIGADVLVWECDVEKPQECVLAIRSILDVRKRIDVLVNAAGVIQVGPVENMEEDDFESSLNTHFWGPLHLIREVIPHMIERGGGRIVNISSIAGLVAVPHLLPYVVGKFAIKGFSDGLRAELARRRIYVTTVCPGLMRTGSHVNAQFKGRPDEEFSWFSMGAAMPLLSVNARRAAHRIVEACRNAQPHLVISPQARVLHLLNAILPNTTARLTAAVARLLPDPGVEQQKRLGWESRSKFAPSILTWPADRAIARNNELPPDIAAVYFSEKRSNGKGR